MIIGVSGLARSGKDTLAEYIQNKLKDYKVIIMPMAKPLKEGCRYMFGFDDRHLYGELKETYMDEYGKSPREIMQLIGTEFGREMICNDIWVKINYRYYTELQKKYNNLIFIVPDIRFPDEADYIRSKGKLIFIDRKSAGLKGSTSKHKSENNDFRLESDLSIDNNKELCDYYKEIDKFITNHIIGE